MSIKIMNLVWQNAPYQGNTLLTLLSLADWSNDDGESWPAVETIAKKSRQSERNCRTTLGKLSRDGIVIIQEREGESSIYKINTDVLRDAKTAPLKKSTRGGKRLPKVGKSLPEIDAKTAPNTSIEPPVEPSIDLSSSQKNEKRMVDQRFIPIKDFVERCCKYAKVPFVWDGSEAAHLSRWLAAAGKDLSLDSVIELVQLRFRSATSPGDRPRIWIGNLGKFAVTKGSPNGFSKAKQRQAVTLEAGERFLGKHGVQVSSDSRGDLQQGDHRTITGHLDESTGVKRTGDD